MLSPRYKGSLSLLIWGELSWLSSAFFSDRLRRAFNVRNRPEAGDRRSVLSDCFRLIAEVPLRPLGGTLLLTKGANASGAATHPQQSAAT